MQIRQFVDEGLGNSTHLVISERTGLAALIDPLRDVDRYLDAAAGAQHVEAGDLAAPGVTLPQDRPIATHCGHEQRSATALSVLERQGYR